jgi:AcrR family transcriptional regulator
MPRHVDPQLEGKVLDAARKLWHKGGEKALSMRAVAKMAGTNTPALYRRFRNREDILKALVRAYQQELAEIIKDCDSLQEVAHCYLDFALRHPREYQLIMSGLLARMSKSRPNIQFLTERSSDWLGGRLGEHRALVLALAALAHGTAMLKITDIVLEEDYATLRKAYASAVDVLVANERKLRPKNEVANRKSETTKSQDSS